MNGVTGRMGYRQHLVRSILAMREQGGLALPDGTVAVAGAGARRPQRGQARGPGGRARARALDHRPGRGAGRRRQADLLRRPAHPPARGRGQEGRSPPASTSTWRSRPRPRSTGAGAGAAGRRGGREARRGAGQALPARPAQAQAAGGRRLLRPDPVRARRVRLLGVRGRLAAGAAPVLELPGRGRRRHHPRHVPALALRARAHHRAGPLGLRAHGSRTSRERVDELGKPYQATADDAAYGVFELEGGVVAQINSSWAVRVNREELVEFQVDGTHGSAVAGLRDCKLPAPRRDAEAGVEPGHPEHGAVPRAVADRAGQRRIRQRIQDPVGAVPRARRAGRAARPCTTCGPARRACSWPSWASRPPPRAAGSRFRSCCRRAGAVDARSPVPSSPPRTWWPTRTRRTPRAPRPSSTGTRRSRSGTGSGRWASASPTRWTPRSAAWAWTGPRRRS